MIDPRAHVLGASRRQAPVLGRRSASTRWTGLAIGLLFLLFGPSSSQAQSPYPPRQGFLAIGAEVSLSEARLEREFAERLGQPYGIDGLALIVDSCQPDPEAYVDGAAAHYALAPDAGQLYDDAMLWMVCFDPRYVGFFYAAESPNGTALDAAQAADQVSTDMAQRLAAGNFTGAITAGIDRTARILDAAAASPSEGISEEPASPGSAAPAERQPVEQDEGGSLAGQIAAAGALGLGGLWLWRRRKRKQAAESKRTAAAGAEGAAMSSPRESLQAEVAALSTRLTKESPALARLILAYESIGEEAMLAVSRRHEGMLERLDALRNGLEALPAQAGTSAASTEADADAELPALGLLREEAEALSDYADEIEAEAEHVEMLQARAAVLTVEARKAIAETSEAYPALAAAFEGLPDEAPSLPTAAAALRVPELLAEQAESVLGTGDRITAGRLAEDAATLASKLAQLLEQAAAVDTRIEAGVDLYERLEAYAEASWADLRGNGSEAEESWDAAYDMSVRVLGSDPEAFGQDPAAGFMESLERIAEELARARSLIDAMAERLERLEAARQRSHEALEAARQDLVKARDFLSRSDVGPDVSAAPERELDRAEAMLAEAETGLLEADGEQKPDWLAILRNIQSASGRIVEALAESERQNERVDALRNQLGAKREETGALLDRAERYLDLHRADAGPLAVKRVQDARAALDTADRASRQAERHEDAERAAALEEALEACAEAERAAQTAYEMLAADVAEAEKRRRGYVPRPTWIGPTVPAPMPGRRSIFFPDPFAGMGGSSRPRRRSVNRPARRSSWGSRPRRSTRPARPSRRSRPSSTRRGGGRSW